MRTVASRTGILHMYICIYMTVLRKTYAIPLIYIFCFQELSEFEVKFPDPEFLVSHSYKTVVTVWFDLFCV